jgi:hypothetical protein
MTFSDLLDEYLQLKIDLPVLEHECRNVVVRSWMTDAKYLELQTKRRRLEAVKRSLNGLMPFIGDPQ